MVSPALVDATHRSSWTVHAFENGATEQLFQRVADVYDSYPSYLH